MEKGMAVSFEVVLFFIGLCKSLASKAALDVLAVLDDDKTSCSLAGGSFLFSFQIPVFDHGKDEPGAVPQPAAVFILGLAEGWGQLIRSLDGVAGRELFGLYGPLSCVDGFLVAADGISFSQEVRRAGLIG